MSSNLVGCVLKHLSICLFVGRGWLRVRCGGNGVWFLAHL